MNNPCSSEKSADVKASSPIRTSLSEREGSMWGSLKRLSQRRPVSMIEECRANDSELCLEALHKGWLTQEQVCHAAERYQLGKSRSGKTTFWMIDDLGICRDGHIGSAPHGEHFADTWVSTMLKRRCPELAQYVKPQHCLFGLHLLAACQREEELALQEGEKSICLVESERTAVILSELQPQLLWMAYVYPVNLTVDQFEPLRHRVVTIFPRTDPQMDHYTAALEVADQVKRRYPIDIRVSTLLEDNASAAQKERRIDLLDYFFDL